MRYLGNSLEECRMRFDGISHIDTNMPLPFEIFSEYSEHGPLMQWVVQQYMDRMAAATPGQKITMMRWQSPERYSIVLSQGLGEDTVRIDGYHAILENISGNLFIDFYKNKRVVQ
jgi:hypothetical protein